MCDFSWLSFLKKKLCMKDCEFKSMSMRKPCNYERMQKKASISNEWKSSIALNYNI